MPINFDKIQQWILQLMGFFWFAVTAVHLVSDRHTHLLWIVGKYVCACVRACVRACVFMQLLSEGLESYDDASRVAALAVLCDDPTRKGGCFCALMAGDCCIFLSLLWHTFCVYHSDTSLYYVQIMWLVKSCEVMLHLAVAKHACRSHQDVIALNLWFFSTSISGAVPFFCSF